MAWHKSYQNSNMETIYSMKEEPENEFENLLEYDSEKVVLCKWTGTCERCYQRIQTSQFYGSKTQ